MQPDPTKELQATLAARRELGPDHDDALIESFLERIDRRLEERRPRPVDRKVSIEEKGMQFVMGIVSLGVAIPITGIAISHGLVALAIAWLGIVLVNLAFARAGR